MFGSILSVLLMGMLPVALTPTDMGAELPAILSVAPPSVVTPTPAMEQAMRRGVTASGMLIMDVQSGQEVYGWQADRRRHIASLTKLMTALIIVEHHSMDELVTIPKDLAHTDAQRFRLPPGAQFTVGDMLKALLVVSSNEAADTLARFHSGSLSAFVTEMNERARTLGLSNTSYANPSGLDDNAQWSTPRDLAWLASFVLRSPELASRMSLKETQIQSKDGHDPIVLSHTHELLHTDDAVLAGKTGTTDAAGQCLLSLVKEGNHEYIVVLLRSRERYADMRVLLHILATLV